MVPDGGPLQRLVFRPLRPDARRANARGGLCAAQRHERSST